MHDLPRREQCRRRREADADLKDERHQRIIGIRGALVLDVAVEVTAYPGRRLRGRRLNEAVGELLVADVVARVERVVARNAVRAFRLAAQARDGCGEEFVRRLPVR